jgi:hypothetical protein
MRRSWKAAAVVALAAAHLGCDGGRQRPVDGGVTGGGGDAGAAGPGDAVADVPRTADVDSDAPDGADTPDGAAPAADGRMDDAATIISGRTCEALRCPDDHVCLQSDVPLEAFCVHHCLSFLRDGDETDVNCGGAVCAPCRFGGRCARDADCQSGRCEAGLCAGTCNDGILSDDETNVDCGGAGCAPCAVSFAPAASRSLGMEPRSILASDLDRDGNQDLAVVDTGGGVVWILRGHGDGSFGDAVAFTVGRRPFSVVAGDFNEDGAPDLATADFDDDSITLLLAQQPAGFSAPSRLALEARARPRFVTTADLNEDRHADLVVSSFFYRSTDGSTLGANDVRVFVGRGDGSFVPGARASAGTNPGAVAVADLDGDGHQDLAVAESEGDGVTVLRGDGAGALAPAQRFQAFGWVSGVVAADLDGDGQLDLAASNYT